MNLASILIKGLKETHFSLKASYLQFTTILNRFIQSNITGDSIYAVDDNSLVLVFFTQPVMIASQVLLVRWTQNRTKR